MTTEAWSCKLTKPASPTLLFSIATIQSSRYSRFREPFPPTLCGSDPLKYPGPFGIRVTFGDLVSAVIWLAPNSSLRVRRTSHARLDFSNEEERQRAIACDYGIAENVLKSAGTSRTSVLCPVDYHKLLHIFGFQRSIRIIRRFTGRCLTLAIVVHERHHVRPTVQSMAMRYATRRNYAAATSVMKSELLSRVNFKDSQRQRQLAKVVLRRRWFLLVSLPPRFQ